MCFSQGCQITLKLYQTLQFFGPSLNLKTTLPYFVIFFSGLDMPFHTWSAGADPAARHWMSHVEFIYSGYNRNGLPLESIHINGSNDMFFMFNNEYLRFENPC